MTTRGEGREATYIAHVIGFIGLIPLLVQSHPQFISIFVETCSFLNSSAETCPWFLEKTPGRFIIIWMYIIIPPCIVLFLFKNPKLMPKENPSFEDIWKTLPHRRMWIQEYIKEFFKDLRLLWIHRIFSKFYLKNIRVDSFKVPRSWPNYENTLERFFNHIVRLYDEDKDVDYELRFSKDFDTIAWRENKKGEFKYNELKSIAKSELPNNIKLFTWTTVYGVYWNTWRSIRRLFVKKANIKQMKKNN